MLTLTFYITQQVQDPRNKGNWSKKKTLHVEKGQMIKTSNI